MVSLLLTVPGCIDRGGQNDRVGDDSAGVDSGRRDTDADADTDTDSDSSPDSWDSVDTSPRAGDRSVAEADVTVFGSGEDYVAKYLSVGSDINGDGVPELVVGTHSGEGGFYDSGGDGGEALKNTVYVVDAVALAGSHPAEDVAICEHAAGGQVQVLPDLDGDGRPEIATGAGYPVGASVFSGSGCPEQPFIELDCTDGYCPMTVLGAGGVGADGSIGVLVQAGPYDDGERRAFLVDGGAVGTVNVDQVAWPITSSVDNGIACSGMVQDFDGDGIADVLVTGLKDEGAVYLLHGPVNGARSIEDADGVVEGFDPEACARGMAADDWNGDGAEDLGLGLPSAGGSEEPGLVRLFWGPVTGTRASSSSDAQIFGEGVYAAAGIDISAIGDANQDGSRDLLVGAADEDLEDSNAGAAYVMSGPFGGDESLSDATTRFTGDSNDNKTGFTVNAADLNSDGLLDYFIGAPQGGPDDFAGGALYVFWGQP